MDSEKGFPHDKEYKIKSTDNMMNWTIITYDATKI